MRIKNLFLYLNIFVFVLVSSCTSYKHISYFKDIPDSLNNQPLTITTMPDTELSVRHGDILQISIQSIDPELNSMFGTANSTVSDDQSPSMFSASRSDGDRASNAAVVPGFMVDKDGYIELPLAGKIKAAGYTTTQIKNLIRDKASKFYQDPVVNVRLSNFKVTVLGEVARPGTYIMPNENINVLDALGVAGDLTIYARRDNVMLIRQHDGEKTVVRLNLNSSRLLKSPYFNLQQGDLIYVDPGKTKAASSDVSKTRTITAIAAIASVLIIALSRVNIK